MKASELRIGNIVIASFSTGDNTLHTVTAGDFGKSAAGTLVCESFQPERLTEEWLERFGFRKQLNNPKEKEPPYYFFPTSSKGLYHDIFRDGFFKLLGDGDGLKILHVHQLQNLYHALTQHELNDRG